MDGASASLIHELRPKIIERRARLQASAPWVRADFVDDLLAEIDATLRRIDEGSYGICETCGDPIEADRLERNPMVRFCLDHLSQRELRAHEQDLELAKQIQAKLLPAAEIVSGNWQTHYRYQPAGVVGGDYCEIVASDNGGSLFFAVGDVAGKGVAASLLMTHLSAIFRSLLPLDLPFTELISRANRLFCESTPATHYATLVAGRTTENGVELCNAGHCRPLVLAQGGTEAIDPTGLPLGLFCEGRYEVRRVQLECGDSLLLYSDGISETEDPDGNVYEEEHLSRSAHRRAGLDARAIVDGVLDDVVRFRGAGPQQDDMTLLVIRRR
jgi:sigma-B regulation protein RsbU (phosphoserine phosphatase)